MEKQFASDELVNTMFEIIKQNAKSSKEIFNDFIYKYIGHNAKPENHDRKTFFETNENDIKKFLKTKSPNEDVFNLNFYSNINKIYDTFFFNPNISLSEKQNLINSHSVRYNFDFSKNRSNDYFKLFISLIPIEDLFKLYVQYQKDNEKIEIIKKYKPEIFNLIEESFEKYPEYPEKYFRSFLFEKIGYISADYIKHNNNYQCKQILPDKFRRIDEGRFYDEFNIDCPERNLYSKFEKLHWGNAKEKSFGYEISRRLTSDNGVAQYHIFSGIKIELTKRLNEIYKVEDMIDSMKKIVNNEILESSKLKDIENFVKGFQTVYKYHDGGSFFDPYRSYFEAISKEKDFSKLNMSFVDFFNHIQKLIDKYHYQVFDNTYIVEPESENDLDKIWKIYLPKSKSDLEELTIYIKKDFSNEEIIDIIDKEIRRNLLMDKNKTLHISCEYNDGKVSEINFFAINAKTPSFTAITVAEEIKREEKSRIENENKNIEIER